MKKYLSLLIMVLCCINILSACKPKEAETPFCDFESIEDIRVHNYVNYFGKATLNTDGKYITSNEGSLKAEIYGEPLLGVTNYPSIFLYTKENKDFSYVTNITLDIFNANDFEVILYMGLKDVDGVSGTALNGEFSALQEIVLERNKLNKVNFLFDRSAMATKQNITNITSIVLMFNNRLSLDEKVTTLYIDNVQLVKTKKLAGQYVRERKANEIFDFEYVNDLSVIKVYGEQYYYGMPLVALNYDLKYVSSGISSLKIRNKPNIGAWGNNRSPCFSFVNDAIADVKDFSNKQYFVFDMFWACDRTEAISAMISDANGATYSKYNIIGEKGKKTEVKIEISEIRAISLQGKPLEISKITNIAFGWNGFKTGEDLVFYIDNIRFE